MTQHIARQALPNEVMLSAYFDKNEIAKITLDKRVFSKNKKIVSVSPYNALITEKGDIVIFSKSFDNNDVLLELSDGVSLKDIWDNPMKFSFIQDFVTDFKTGNLKNPINLTNYTEILNAHRRKKEFFKLYSLIKKVSEAEYNKIVAKQEKFINKVVANIIKSR